MIGRLAIWTVKITTGAGEYTAKDVEEAFVRGFAADKDETLLAQVVSMTTKRAEKKQSPAVATKQ